MSAAPRNRSSWLSQNYDKLILVAILVGLLGSASFLVIQIGWERQQMAGAWWDRPTVAPKSVTPVTTEKYDGMKKVFFEPFKGGPQSNALMVSELRVSCIECGKPIAFNALGCPFCGKEQPAIVRIEDIDADLDGIKDVQERAFGLNPLDPLDAGQDMDRDGFSNIEEISYGTNPRDAADYPPPVVKLRLGRVSRIPFKLRFQGVQKLGNDSVRFQVNLRTLEQTFFVQIGDEVEGFKVTDYKADAPEGPTLMLGQKDETIALVRGKAVEKQELVADIVFLVDRTRMKVRVGDVVTIKDHTYKVIDIRREGVLIRDEKTGKETLAGTLSDSEKSALMGGTSGAVAPGIPGSARPAL